MKVKVTGALTLNKLKDFCEKKWPNDCYSGNLELSVKREREYRRLLIGYKKTKPNTQYFRRMLVTNGK